MNFVRYQSNRRLDVDISGRINVPHHMFCFLKWRYSLQRLLGNIAELISFVQIFGLEDIYQSCLMHD